MMIVFLNVLQELIDVWGWMIGPSKGHMEVDLGDADKDKSGTFGQTGKELHGKHI